jgi:membrane protein YqaA with SNARE-associated domain
VTRLDGAQLSSTDSSSTSSRRVLRWLARDDARMIWQLLLALVGLFVLVAGVGYLLRPQLATLGTAFVDRFGLLGMAFGTYLADGFQFTVAPQFYMLASMVRGGSALWPMLCITAASMAAGCTGYLLAQRASRISFVRRKIDKSRAVVDRLLGRYGAWTFVILSASPVPYSVVCYLLGMYRMPVRYLAVVVGLRGPRLGVMYLVIRAAWAASSN